MNILSELRQRFDAALSPLVDDTSSLLDMIRPATDSKFGDYQANCAMPLKKQLGKNPREIAQDIIDKLDVSDMCEPPEVAGPGFINLKLKDDWITQQLAASIGDERLGVPQITSPKTYVVDYSSPNVAKPMHVGHIRSTVIGDTISRVLRFLGHNVITDNHLGDWGTQFGMIIYGYKNFRDDAAYQSEPIAELSRIYRFVRKIMDVLETQAAVPKKQAALEELTATVEEKKNQEPTGDKAADKKAGKELRKLEGQLSNGTKDLEELKQKLAEMQADVALMQLVKEHSGIATAVLQETVKLHEGDEENLKLWHEFLPKCRDEIQRVYDRLNITFDVEYGESFYHDRLGDVVADFEKQGLATESDGATCVFLDGFKAPMIIRKQDGAFLYATTDLATIQYRLETWKPDAMLYVVDHRQGEHFDKLFAAAKLWGCEQIEMKHVSFGTVMGPDGKPYKTRSGDTVGLEGLLDEAVSRALNIVSENDDKKETPDFSEEQRKNISELVGIGGLKYGDLSQNRETDYIFSYDKMLALTGNTATYMQYAYARVQSIFRRGAIDIEQLRQDTSCLNLAAPEERNLAMAILRFAEALEDVTIDYRPNLLTNYLFEDLAKSYSTFFANCPVLKAEDEATKNSRALLCDLTARVIKQGLDLLGISTVDKM